MFTVDVISRIAHVLTAIALVGGSIFTLVALLPALKVLDEEARKSFAEAVNSKWKRIVHLGILVFLVSGFYNYMQAIDSHRGDGLYHALLGTKMLLAFFIFFIASALVGRSAKLEPIRAAKGKWLCILVLTALVIVSISGFVKIRGATSPEPATADVSMDPGILAE